jgi:hypothetical protein
MTHYTVLLLLGCDLAARYLSVDGDNLSWKSY